MADDGWTYDEPSAVDAAVVASWPRSAAEAEVWVSRAEHPFLAEVVASWWAEPDVSPRVLRDPDGVLVGYGELWDDAEEDEVELARLIVDPDRRGLGVGRRLVDALVGEARTLGRSAVVLRVRSENASARTLYRTAGFTEVPPDEAAAWNEGQPFAYTWMRLDPGATPSV